MRLAGTLYAAAYFLLVMVAFILPFFTSEGYSLISNSLSELGAQATPGSWLMNIVFVLLSVATVLLGTKVLRLFWLPLYLLYAFALFLFLTTIFRHAPIADVFFWEKEHVVHSIFSFLTGLAFSAFCITIAFYIKNKLARASAILMFSIAIGLSLLMVQFPEYKGIFQRLLFLIAFGWLFYSMVTFRFQKPAKKHIL